jgi:oxygen-independent coproporphyrinogen-3 oxidase
MRDLIEKYNIPTPRYTSYPTVPYWDNDLTEQKWIEHIKKAFTLYNKDGLSLYIHLPFCESLCTYCACNTRITVNHAVEKPYIETLFKEWNLYLKQFNEVPIIKEIHLGGGTPTFFSPDNLKLLISSILSTVKVNAIHEFSFEGHPGNTTKEHLKVLFDLGFRRVSFGVQDFDLKVQEAINRYQSFEQVKDAIQTARQIGFTSINIDLVYGLPHQIEGSVRSTIEKIIELKPERIAYYSYAHVPWLKPGQRKYDENDLPESSVKRRLYELGRELLLKANYQDVGMDHFALSGDALFAAFKKKKLHRNFMGYTTNTTKLLVGLGCSAIGDSWNAFAQNIKTVEEYSKKVNEGSFPIFKGHSLTKEDITIRKHILNLMCAHESDFKDSPTGEMIFRDSLAQLDQLLTDNLIEIKNYKITITKTGRDFLRNICMAFDKRYHAHGNTKQQFSTTA